MNFMLKLLMTSTVPLIDLKRAACRVAVAVFALALLVPPGASTLRAARQAGGAKAVAFKGVSFYYDGALASNVKAVVAPGGECGKPGDVMPAHVAFTLEGYPKPHALPFMSPPEIQVFPIADYRRALAACEKELAADSTPPVSTYVSDFDAQVRTLKALVAARPAPPRALTATLNRRDRGREYLRGRMPFVPMYDVGEALRAKVSYLDFRNGAGVAFVTQFTMEDTLISNQALAYVFQGITADGEYYVSAAFPVAAPFLPADYTDEEAARHGLKLADFSPAARRKYKAYLAATARKLEALAPDKYRPALGPLDNLVRSLHVNHDLLKSSVQAR